MGEVDIRSSIRRSDKVAKNSQTERKDALIKETSIDEKRIGDFLFEMLKKLWGFFLYREGWASL